MMRSGVNLQSGTSIEIEFDTHIRAVRPSDNRDVYLVPGFVDIQVNGFAGVDYNSAATPAEAVVQSADCIRQAGVTRFFPTVITGPAEDMLAALRNLAAVRDRSIAGFHVEGPHLSPEEGPRGCN